jgi:hypothetical protein
MTDGVRRRFWIETGLALVSGLLALLTLLWKDWIELVFKVDPDASSGALEWLIMGVLLAITLTTATLARREWSHRLAVSA